MKIFMTTWTFLGQEICFREKWRLSRLQKILLAKWTFSPVSGFGLILTDDLVKPTWLWWAVSGQWAAWAAGGGQGYSTSPQSDSISAVGSVDFGVLSLFGNSEATLSVLNKLQLILGSEQQVEAKDTQPHLSQTPPVLWLVYVYLLFRSSRQLFHNLRLMWSKQVDAKDAQPQSDTASAVGTMYILGWCGVQCTLTFQKFWDDFISFEYSLVDCGKQAGGGQRYSTSPRSDVASAVCAWFWVSITFREFWGNFPDDISFVDFGQRVVGGHGSYLVTKPMPTWK